MISTWDKTLKLGKKKVTKKQILRHYARLWKNDPEFRRLVKRDGVFVRAVYGSRPVIKRRNIKVKSFEDLKELIKEHAVEFHIPQRKLDKEIAIDVDVPKKLKNNGKKNVVLDECLQNLKRETRVKAVVKTPDGGFHIHIKKIPKRKLFKLLKPVEEKHSDYVILGKKKKRNKINIDVAEPNIAIPGSLSVYGSVYKKLKHVGGDKK